MRKMLLGAVVAMAIITPPAAGEAQRADPVNLPFADIDKMRGRVVDLYTGRAVTGSGPRHKAATESLAQRAANLLAGPPRRLKPGAPRLNDDVARLYMYVLTMARAYVAPGTRLTGSEDLKKRIEADLREGLKWIRPGAERPGNWYPWIISIPQRLGPTLIMLDGKIDRKLHAESVEAMADLMGEPLLNGANAVWDARNRLHLGLLKRDPRVINTAWRFLMPELTVHNDSGILEDYSYQFHGRLVHTSGYGSGFAESAARLIYLAEGTGWRVPQENKQLFARHLLEHCRWVIVGQHYDLSVKGRGVLYSNVSTAHLNAMLLMAAVDTPLRKRLSDAAAEMLARRTAAVPLGTAAFADALGDLQTQPLVGFRHFYASDFAVFRGSDFYVSVRMYSKRLIDYEGNWGANLKGWFLCYGLTYISRTGNELWADPDTMRKHWDWDRLPGTTTRVGVHPAKPYNTGTASFAGGAGSEKGGVCAFRLVPAAGDFVAQKSYVFFDKGFLALGSGITSTAAHDEPVVTTVTQWAAPEENLPLVLSGGRKAEKLEGQGKWDNVQWAWHDGVGHIFPKPVTLHGHRRGKLTTLWLDHGNAPKGATYAYIVLPKATLEETEQFAAAPAIRIQQLDEDVHRCEASDDSGGGIVFWEAGKAAGMQISGPAVICGQKQDDAIVVAIQNPLHTQSPLTLTGDKPPGPTTLPPEVSIKEFGEDGMRMTVNTAAGRIYRIGVSLDEVGDKPPEVQQPPREDNLAYEAFKVRAESKGNVTHLTVHVPEPAAKEGYRLLVRGPKGHLRAELTDKDIVERPAANVVRYRWDHSALAIRPGNLRIVLVTKMHLVIRYITVPPQSK